MRDAMSRRLVGEAAMITGYRAFVDLTCPIDIKKNFSLPSSRVSAAPTTRHPAPGGPGRRGWHERPRAPATAMGRGALIWPCPLVGARQAPAREIPERLLALVSRQGRGSTRRMGAAM